MPWKLDFVTNDKEATFWLWEQKWRTFYNFIGKMIYLLAWHIAPTLTFSSEQS
jgi:hypothetical protein